MTHSGPSTALTCDFFGECMGNDHGVFDIADDDVARFDVADSTGDAFVVRFGRSRSYADCLRAS